MRSGPTPANDWMMAFSVPALSGSRERWYLGYRRLNGSIFSRRSGLSSLVQTSGIFVGSIGLGLVANATKESNSSPANVRAKKDFIPREFFIPRNYLSPPETLDCAAMLNVAIVGLGNIGNNHANCYK